MVTWFVLRYYTINAIQLWSSSRSPSKLRMVHPLPATSIVLVFDCACIHVAVNHLHGAMLYGKKIHVVLSKHSQVQMPQAGSNVSIHVCVEHRRGKN